MAFRLIIYFSQKQIFHLAGSISQTVDVSFAASLACVSGLSCGLERLSHFITESDVGGRGYRAFSVHLCSLGLSVDKLTRCTLS